MRAKILTFTKIVFLALILCFFLSFPSSAQQSKWPMFQGNPARTGFSASSLPSKAKILWQITVGNLRNLGIDGFETKRPIIDNNKVLFATSEVFGLNLQNGEILWHYKDDNTPFYPGALAAKDNKVFFAVNNTGLIKTMSIGSIYALDQKTGNFFWKYQTNSSISHSKPLLAQGKIFIGDDAGYIYAIDANTGSLVWEKRVVNDGVIHASPAYADNKVFITTEGDALYYETPQNPSSVLALNPDTGEVVWSFAIDYIANRVNLIHSTPVISNGTLFVGSENGWFYALSASDGKLIWKKQIATGNGVVGSSAPAAVGYHKVFIGTWQNQFFALDAKNGDTVWESDFGYANNAAPLLADNKVCIAGADGYFYCLDVSDGKLFWKENFTATATALANGILVAPASIGDNFNNQTPLLIAFIEETTSPTLTEPTAVPTVLPVELQSTTPPSEALSLSPIAGPSADKVEVKEASCGNTICEEDAGENEKSCPKDCIAGNARPFDSPTNKVATNKEIQPDKQKGKNYLKIALFAAGLILASTAGTGIWFFWKKKKKPIVPTEEPPISQGPNKS